MAKKPNKIYSGRNGYSALDNGFNIPRAPGSRTTPTVGERTTVRSGVKSSKTYLTTSPGSSGGQTFLEDSSRKTNKKKSTKKK